MTERAAGGFTVQLAVTVTNNATRPGSEVVQAYVAQPLGSSEDPLLTLVGFTKVQVEPESSTKVSVSANPHPLKRRLGFR